jgi:hypothetical protein
MGNENPWSKLPYPTEEDDIRTDVEALNKTIQDGGEPITEAEMSHLWGFKGDEDAQAWIRQNMTNPWKRETLQKYLDESQEAERQISDRDLQNYAASLGMDRPISEQDRMRFTNQMMNDPRRREKLPVEKEDPYEPEQPEGKQRYFDGEWVRDPKGNLQFKQTRVYYK